MPADSLFPECPNCGARGSLSLFEVARDINNRASQIFSCRSCMALLNGNGYAALARSGDEDIQKSALYHLDDKIRADPEGAATDRGRVFEYMYTHVQRDWSRLTFLDFGAGAGVTSAAAARRFKRVIACEFDLGPAREMARLVKGGERIEFAKDLSGVKGPIDVVFMWHVLEHLPYPVRFWQQHAPKLAPNCVFYLQIPLYRPVSVFDAHCIFHNDASLRRWAKALNIEITKIEYDLEYGFGTLLGTWQAPRGDQAIYPMERGSSGSFTGYFTDYGGQPGFERLATEIMRRYDPMSILHLGCATGPLVKCFHDYGRTAQGVDTSEWAIQNGIVSGLHQAELHALPFADNMFDFAISQDGMNHIRPGDLAPVFAEQVRVVKPGGYIAHFIPLCPQHERPGQPSIHLCNDGGSWWRARLADVPGVEIVREPPRQREEGGSQFLLGNYYILRVLEPKGRRKRRPGAVRRTNQAKP
jgi:2-polyprenyl-3-methyl-5-hydroxy-6-metoxy-1,4-benzoquinol methylase